MKIKDILTEIGDSDLTRSRPNTPPPGTKIATPKVKPGTGADGPAGKYATPKERGAGYELARAQQEYDEYLQRKGADGPAGKDATPKVKPGTGADGPAGKYATPKVKPGTGKYGPANRYDTVDLKGTSGDGWEIDDDGELTITITEPKGPPEEEAFGGDPSVLADMEPIVDPLDALYPYKAPDGRRLKYPHGDIRNAFHSSPDSREAGSDVVVKGGNIGKRMVDKKPVPRMSDDDRK